MPLLLLIAGLLLIIAGVRNTIGSLAGHIQEDVQSQVGGTGFIAWFAAIIVIGGLGFVPQLRSVSRALLTLVVLVLLLKNQGGFFTQFVQQISNPPLPTQAQASVPANLPAIPVQFINGSPTTASPSGKIAGGTAGSAVGSAAGAASGIPGGATIGSIVGGWSGL